jgi:hypothetical protein
MKIHLEPAIIQTFNHATVVASPALSRNLEADQTFISLKMSFSQPSLKLSCVRPMLTSCGVSDPDAEVDMSSWLSDLESVVDLSSWLSDSESEVDLGVWLTERFAIQDETVAELKSPECLIS